MRQKIKLMENYDINGRVLLRRNDIADCCVHIFRWKNSPQGLKHWFQIYYKDKELKHRDKFFVVALCPMNN